VLPPSVTSRIQTTDNLLAQMNSVALGLDPQVQSALASLLAMRAAGLIENGVKDVLTHYGQINGNERIKRYVYETISYENSLNCAKIKTVLNRFDPDWWPDIDALLTNAERAAVNSLKGIRDRVAHGNAPGAGYVTIRDYYGECKTFIEKVGNRILPHL